MNPTPANSQPSLLELGQAINQHVQQVCCIGSYNRGSCNQAYHEFLKLIKASYLIFYEPKLGVQKRLNLTLDEQAKYYIAVSTQIVYQRPFPYDIPGILKPNDTVAYTKLDELTTDPFYLTLINRIYPLESKFKFHQLTAKDFLPIIAFTMELERSEITIQRDALSLSLLQEGMEDCQYIKKYGPGEEFSTDDDKALFLKKTFRDVKNSAFFRGIGNCGVMADVAFTAAIADESDFAVTYLRFTCGSAQNVDVVNCIALGNWPEPGCIIIAPWSNNAVFSWKKFEQTPQIEDTSAPKHDNAKVICRLSVAEKQTARKTLLALGYNSWLTSETRQANLQRAQQLTGQFMAMTQSFIPATEQKATFSPKP